MSNPLKYTKTSLHPRVSPHQHHNWVTIFFVSTPQTGTQRLEWHNNSTYATKTNQPIKKRSETNVRFQLKLAKSRSEMPNPLEYAKNSIHFRVSHPHQHHSRLAVYLHLHFPNENAILPTTPTAQQSNICKENQSARKEKKCWIPMILIETNKTQILKCPVLSGTQKQWNLTTFQGITL